MTCIFCRKVKKIVACLLYSILIITFFGCATPVTTSSIEYIEVEGDHPANMLQYNSSAWLDVVNGELCIYLFNAEDDDFQNKIVSVGLNGISTAKKIDRDAYAAAMYGGYFYYYRVDDAYTNYLYCMNITTGETTYLEKTDGSIFHPTFLNDSSVICFPNGDSKECFALIQRNSCTGELNQAQEYAVGEQTYRFTNYGELMLCNTEGENILITQANPLFDPIICGGGLLIHTGNSENLLSFLSSDGTLTALFSTESDFVRSTVNFHDDQVFLSVLCEQWGPGKKGMIPYEKDNVSGTYRIDMNNYSATKISDIYYEGIYIFNGKQLYCVDDSGNVVMTDFTGHIQQEIVGITRDT